MVGAVMRCCWEVYVGVCLESMETCLLRELETRDQVVARNEEIVCHESRHCDVVDGGGVENSLSQSSYLIGSTVYGLVTMIF